MTRTGDREIRSVSGRLPDNPGELAYMSTAKRLTSPDKNYASMHPMDPKSSCTCAGDFM